MGLKPSQDSIFALFLLLCRRKQFVLLLADIAFEKNAKTKRTIPKNEAISGLLKKHYALTKQFCKQVED